jgi:PAS domain S-box-containing protein
MPAELSSDLFRQSFDHSVLPVIWFNRQADLIYVNQAAADYLGYPVSELMEMKLFDINPVITPGNWEIVCQKIQTSEVSTVNTVHRTKDGRNLEVEIRRNRINYNGEDIFQLNIVSIGAEKAITLKSEFELVFESFPDYLFRFSKENKIEFAKTGKGAVYFGNAESLKGKSTGDIFPDTAGAILTEALQKARSTGETVQVFIPSGRDDNQWFEASIIPLYTGALIAYLRNISESKNNEEQLKTAYRQLHKSEEIYRTMAKNIPNGFVFMFDKQLRYTLIEGDVLKTLPYFSELKEGRTPGECLPPHQAQPIIPLYKEVLKGQTVTFEIKGEQTHHYFQATLSPVRDSEGEVVGGIAMGIDIDKLKKIEIELQQRIDQLGALNQRLEKEVKERVKVEKELKVFADELIRKNSELEQFAYVASHDLQEPLRMVSSYTQLLATKYENRLDADANEFIHFAIEGAVRMQSLINGLLNYSRVSRRMPEYATVDLNNTINDCLNIMRVTIAEADAKVEVISPLPSITGDPIQITQLFQNLISNAIKFKREDEKPVIEISSEEDENKYIIRVKDNGIGIDPQHGDRIFQIFQRLHTRQQYPGTGIGLAICKKITEHHNGRIFLEDGSQGATFTIEWPKTLKQEKETSGKKNAGLSPR